MDGADTGVLPRLRFEPGGWSELMRLEPGSVVSLHRHTGEVHAFNLSGTREITGAVQYLGTDGKVTETVDAAPHRASPPQACQP
jgi:hypothetical protein